MFDFDNFFKKGKKEETDEKEMNEELEKTDTTSEEEISEFDKNNKLEKVDGKWVYKYKDTPPEPEQKKVDKPDDTGDTDDEMVKEKDHRSIEDDDDNIR